MSQNFGNGHVTAFLAFFCFCPLTAMIFLAFGRPFLLTSWYLDWQRIFLGLAPTYNHHEMFQYLETQKKLTGRQSPEEI